LNTLNYHRNLQPAPLPEPARNDAILLRDYVAGRRSYHFLKRLLDIIFSSLFIVLVLSWLVPVVGLLIFVNSKGPVFFRQKRVGRNGNCFYCLKFRTMKLNAEADVKQAEADDDRITAVGKFLRKTNIDEFPQFINVFLGHMSVVGPRPHMLSDCVRFSFVIPAYDFRTLVRPGITGLAQVKGYHGPTEDYESIFIRYHWDSEYIRNASLLLDLKILTLTIFECLGNLIYLSWLFIKKDELIM
jgi:putative colanic acid biosysnthesis UDP-glucose lipid carrier transferase